MVSETTCKSHKKEEEEEDEERAKIHVFLAPGHWTESWAVTGEGERTRRFDGHVDRCKWPCGEWSLSVMMLCCFTCAIVT